MHKKDTVTGMALDRIRILSALAESRARAGKEPDRRLAKRYVQIAKAISSRYKVGMPKKIKSRICNGCGNFLVPGINCKVRVVSSRGYMAYMCECGSENHVFYKKLRKRDGS